jgi:multidrug efflux pump subunit AcrB
MIGALAGMLLAQQPLSLYGQIGMVLLVGMASKTAILIVEFGKSLRERGRHPAGTDLFPPDTGPA